MTVELSGEQIFIGYNEPEERQQAERLVRRYVDVWAFRTGIRVEVVFDRWWRTSPTGHTDYSKELSGTIRPSGELTCHVIYTGQRTAPASIALEHVSGFADMAFLEDDALVEKAGRDPALESALRFLNEEVVDQERPLYGVYKATAGRSADHVGHESGHTGCHNMCLGTLSDASEW
jgi:hypothetical protein